MILNRNRVCASMRQWTYLIVLIGVIGFVMRLPAAVSTAISVVAQQAPQSKPDPEGLNNKDRSLISMAKNGAYDDLIQIVLTDPDPGFRHKAFLSLILRASKDGVSSLVKLYNKSRDPMVKEIIVHNLGSRNELDSLTTIARTDPSPQYRQLATEVIKCLMESGDSNQIKPRDASPPPPPRPASLTVSIDATPPPRSDQTQSGELFALMRETAYAYMRRDPVILERILADDYFGTDESGAIYKKAQEIAGVKRFDHAIKKFEFNDYSLSGHQQMAVADILGTANFQADGKDLTAQHRYTVTFAVRKGQWKVVGFHLRRKL
jgi:Domain of unknown function (DUF4440)